MNIEIEILQENLCKMMCAEVNIIKKSEKLLLINTPFFFADGDPYLIYIKERPNGLLRLSDNGHTLMHMSYENDIDKFREGTRGNIFNTILSETGIAENNGEIFIDTNSGNLVQDIFKLGQGLTKITDLTFLNRIRVESTFYDDLKDSLYKIIGEDKIEKDYISHEIEDGSYYPIDYYIKTAKKPLYVFGVTGKDKARLTTIVLERLRRHNVSFESLIVFENQALIPNSDLARLMNVGDEMLSSLTAKEDLARKLLKFSEN